MRVVWTPEAIARLDDIEAYIAQDSPENAKEVIARLLARARQLETAALSGREVPEYRREDIRELLGRGRQLRMRDRGRSMLRTWCVSGATAVGRSEAVIHS